MLVMVPDLHLFETSHWIVVGKKALSWNSFCESAVFSTFLVVIAQLAEFLPISEMKCQVDRILQLSKVGEN